MRIEWLYEAKLEYRDLLLYHKNTVGTQSAEKFAKMGASEGKPVESPVEARSLMDALFACSNSEYTSNGRKIMTVMSPEDIDKMF